MSTELSGRAFRRGRSGATNGMRTLRGDLHGRPTEVDFTIDHLGEVRSLVADAAESVSLAAERRADLVLAVNELATNSICHGGGRGRLRMWRDENTLLCEVSDSGHIPYSARQTERERPEPDAMSGRGLWLVDQLCDAMHIESSPRTGSSVRVHMRLP